MFVNVLLDPSHVESYDFVFDGTEDGRTLKFLTVVDEFSRFRSAGDTNNQENPRCNAISWVQYIFSHGLGHKQSAPGKAGKG